ncbi:hypothetical protein [Pseudomaricurvus sp.]|uniref:hypothetical protein n=1 Tax=Pseudomaricurvus sp. TaxID=2004510 RepID=UPI003F6AA132
MSNPYQSRVQQKLSHCRMTVQWLETASNIGRQEEEALLQGALIHLAVACRLYLRELGHNLAVKSPERIFQVWDLVDACPEGAGVEELKSQEWIAPLFMAERHVLNPSVSASSPQLIAMDASAAQTEELSLERVKRYLTALSGLVERQRQSFEEY